MHIVWSAKSQEDIQRLYDFLNPVNPAAALEFVAEVKNFATLLKNQPRLGRPLSRYEPREVRSGIIGRYEVRYEINNAAVISILRIWHTRENR